MRACSEHLPTLLRWYEQFDRESKVASGISEEHTEKLDLLEEINTLLEESALARQKQQQKASDAAEKLNSAGAIAMQQAEKR